MSREKKDIRPVLFKFGVALALSLGGIVYSVLRRKRIKPSQSPPGHGNHGDSGHGRAGKKIDHQALQSPSSSYNTNTIAQDKYEELPCQPKVLVDISVAALSPSSQHSEDKDDFLLPEFNELVKEFDMGSIRSSISPKKDMDTPHFDVETPRVCTKCDETEEYEQEIKNLRNLVRILKDRERALEIQLLEYYGLKEQETAFMELQNRLKINNMEAKLFTLKIESLQADNRRLEAQVADYAKVVTELDVAKTKIKLLRKKLRSETEQNKEQLVILQERVRKLQDLEDEAATSDLNTQMKLQRLDYLEEEVEKLRKSNHNLQLENSDLAQKLESTQMLANSVLEDAVAEALKKESHHLRKQNEDLTKEVEQLQADRCADAEELVYLRWINACLRYELRHYQPAPGKMAARDLSKTLSPKSEEKAKQLILEYANRESLGEKGVSPADFDSDRWSSSQSYVTDSGDLDDSSVDNSSANKTSTSSKMKIFSKLRRLVLGKDGHHRRSRSASLERTAPLERTISAGAVMGMCNLDVLPMTNAGIENRLGNKSRTSSANLSRCSSDIQMSKSLKLHVNDSDNIHRNSDAGLSCNYKNIVTIDEGTTETTEENQLDDQNRGALQKSELVKYAEVIRDSYGERSYNRRRSASSGSF